MRLLLLGAPGAGKGTQGARLASTMAIRHIATGDVLRAEVESNSETGRRAARYLRCGELVPDDLIIDALTPALVAAAGRGGYILDGFPRTAAQARELDAIGARLNIALERAVYIDVPQHALRQRLLARAELEGRSDDTPDVITRRLQIFAATTRPVIERYRQLGILVTVDGSDSVDEITNEILDRLSERSGAR